MKINLLLIIIISFLSIAQSVSSATVNVPVVKANDVINPIMAEFIIKNIEKAEKNQAELIIIQLDTPGGFDTSMRDIVKKISSSTIPVVVYVAPTGSRAASAGVFILLSAHIAAMAPGTNIGAAHPVAIGEGMDETVAKKAENDAAAYIKSLAEKRGRNAEWAEKAVRESVSITENEALDLKVIDIVEKDVYSLLKTINGWTIETSAGNKTLNTDDAVVEYIEMGLRHKILSLIGNPNVAYMLILLGFYGIFFELTNPGSIFPGVLGALFLILAFYSFQTLPVNYAGLLLIILAIVLFILEIKITSYGLLTVGGLISLTLGSIMLFDSPFPFQRVSLEVIIPAVVLTTIFFALTVALVIQAHRSRPTTGAEGLIGLEGQVKGNIDNSDGSVFVHGEIWKAFSNEVIKKGEKVLVEKVDGLKLKVKKKES
jgi:membrane-bound serine protease (ClpP class)